MPTTEEVLRLVMETIGTENLDVLRRALEQQSATAKKAQADIYDFADAYEIVGAESQRIISPLAGVERQLTAVDHAMEEIARDSERAAAGIAKVGDAATRAGGGGSGSAGIASIQQSAMAASYAFQDFTSTSGSLSQKLNSVTNNIPALTSWLNLLGPYGRAASIGLSIAGTAAVALYANWSNLTRLMEEKQPFKPAADDIGALKRELERAKDEMEKLEKNTSLTRSELEKYNGLRSQAADIEAKIADQQERQQRLKKALEAKSEDEKDTASGFEKAMDGKGEETRDAIREAFASRTRKQINAMREQVNKEQVEAINNASTTEEGQKEYERLEKGFQDGAKAWLKKAGDDADKLFDDLLQGKEGASDRFFKLADETGSYIDFHGVDKRFKKLTPDAKRTDALEKEGQEIQKETLADMLKTPEGRAQLAPFQNSSVPEIAEAAKKAAEQMKKDAPKKLDKAIKKAMAPAKPDKAFDETMKNTEARTKAIERGGLGKVAEALMAEHIARGGQVDEHGRLDERAGAQFQGMLAAQIRRQNPKMSQQEANFHAGEIAGNAQENVNNKIIGLAGQTSSSQQAALRLAQTMNHELGQLTSAQKAMMRELQKMQRESIARARSQQRKGN